MIQSLLLAQPKKLSQALIICLTQWTAQSSLLISPPSVFDLKTTPTITLSNYLIRIFNYMGCSLSCYVYALILLDKIQQQNQDFKITIKNVYRLLITSIVLAAKFLDDKYYKNSYYATVGGISVQTMNEMQLQMLKMLNFNCPLNPEIFQSYIQKLEQFVQVKEKKQQKKKIPKKQSLSRLLTDDDSSRQRFKQERQRSRQKSKKKNIQQEQASQKQNNY